MGDIGDNSSENATEFRLQTTVICCPSDPRKAKSGQTNPPPMAGMWCDIAQLKSSRVQMVGSASQRSRHQLAINHIATNPAETRMVRRTVLDPKSSTSVTR